MGELMRHILLVLTFTAVLSIMAIGAMLGLCGIPLGLFSGGPETVTMVTLSASLSVLSLALGSASAWHAWHALRGDPSTAFRPRRIWPLAVLFLLALALGQTMLSLSLLPALTFPLLHIAAAVLPALFIVALAGRALGGVATWRDMVLQTACGAFLATPLAFVLEATAILLIASATLLGLALQPGGQDLLLKVTSYLQDPAWLQDPEALGSALLTPGIIAAAIAVLAGIIPLLEEAVKTVGVGLAAYRQPSLPQTVLWGTAAGAGFAITEGLLNAAGSLDTWLPVVALRVGTTLLHCTTGALMGLAWYHVLAHRRWRRALALYLLSIAVHGLWNALAVGMALPSLQTIANPTGEGQLAAGLGTFFILLLLGGLILALTAALGGLIVHARRQIPATAPTSRREHPVSGPALSSESAVPED